MIIHLGDRSTLTSACGRPIRPTTWWMEDERIRHWNLAGIIGGTEVIRAKSRDITCVKCRTKMGCSKT